jgi:hypothetical protein
VEACVGLVTLGAFLANRRSLAPLPKTPQVREDLRDLERPGERGDRTGRQRRALGLPLRDDGDRHHAISTGRSFQQLLRPGQAQLDERVGRRRRARIDVLHIVRAHDDQILAGDRRLDRGQIVTRRAEHEHRRRRQSQLRAHRARSSRAGEERSRHGSKLSPQTLARTSGESPMPGKHDASGQPPTRPAEW